MITITGNARQKILEFIDAEEKKGWALRLCVVQNGPRRFQYELNLEASGDKKDDDDVMDCGDFELWFDPRSAEFVEGATMDFVQRGLESGFKFDNPRSRWDNLPDPEGDREIRASPRRSAAGFAGSWKWPAAIYASRDGRGDSLS